MDLDYKTMIKEAEDTLAKLKESSEEETSEPIKEKKEDIFSDQEKFETEMDDKLEKTIFNDDDEVIEL